MSKLLIDENPLILLPSLVTKMGLERALILQQIHYLCQSPKGGKTLEDGHKWTWQTYDEMVAEYFPFWSAKTVQYHILKLEKEGYLLSCQPNQKDWDATKFYRVNTDVLEGYLPNAQEERQFNALDSRQPDALDPHNKDTKTTSKTTNKDIVCEIFQFWKDTMKLNGQTHLTPNRERAINARLKEGYTTDRIKRAILGCASSPYHQGQNDSKTVYNDITLICRNGEKVEFFEQKPITKRDIGCDICLNHPHRGELSVKTGGYIFDPINKTAKRCTCNGTA